MPEVVDTAVQGVNEVVDEVVHGSVQVVRCKMIGMTFLAAMLVVWSGIWLYNRVGKKLTYTSPKKVDFRQPINSKWYLEKYGGRLRGGGNPGPKEKAELMPM
eukprot:5257353-Karenia_brevis.AAC.1